MRFRELSHSANLKLRAVTVLLLILASTCVFMILIFKIESGIRVESRVSQLQSRGMDRNGIQRIHDDLLESVSVVGLIGAALNGDEARREIDNQLAVIFYSAGVGPVSVEFSKPLIAHGANVIVARFSLTGPGSNIISTLSAIESSKRFIKVKSLEIRAASGGVISRDSSFDLMASFVLEAYYLDLVQGSIRR